MFRWSESSSEVRSVLFLFHLKSVDLRYRPLAPCIVREVFAYIEDPLLLPLLGPSRCYNATSRSFVHCRELHLSESSIFCHIRKNVLFVTGDVEATKQGNYLLLAESPVITPSPSFQQARDWPGICYFKDHLYAFGGGSIPASCEMLPIATQHWLSLPNMHEERSAFTPALYKEEIYLCGAGSGRHVLEVFAPASKSFRLTKVTIGGLRLGSVSFFAGETLVIYTRDGKYCEVDVNMEVSREEIKTRKNGTLGVSTLQPVRSGEEILWTSARTGALVVYSLVTKGMHQLR